MKASFIAVALFAALALVAVAGISQVDTAHAEAPSSKHYVLLTDNVGLELCVVVELTSGGDSDSASQVGSISLKLAERGKCDPPAPNPIPEPVPQEPAPECVTPISGYTYQQYMIDGNGNRVPLPAKDAVPAAPCH